MRWTPATLNLVGRIVIRLLLQHDAAGLRPQTTLPFFPLSKLDFTYDNGTPDTPFRSRAFEGITKWVPPTEKLKRLWASVWYASGSARHQSPPAADSLPRGRGIQSARGIHLDSEIDVPDSMFVVTTSCATCGEQFYVTSLESHQTAKYTCPDCSALLLGTKAKATSGETGRPLS